MRQYDKKCDYCHETVSVFESITEFGKHYHERCYIHKTNKELDGYKKKYFNGTMTDGDKIDFIDKHNLVQKLKAERTEFKGFEPIKETERRTAIRTERSVLYLPGGTPVVDQDGNPIIIEEKVPSVSCRYIWFRPRVVRKKVPVKRRLLTVHDLPQLMGESE